MLAGCSGRRSAEPYRRTTPSEYYLYTPPSYTADMPAQLFVGLHGEKQDGYDCFKFWRSYADENGFVLLCPTLTKANGSIDDDASLAVMGASLQAAYKELRLKDTFFLAGFAQGGEFALKYAFTYPQVITAVSAIASRDLPAASAAAVSMPILVVGASGDAKALKASQAYVDHLAKQGFAIRLVVIDGSGARLTLDGARLTIDFLRQVGEG